MKKLLKKLLLTLAIVSLICLTIAFPMYMVILMLVILGIPVLVIVLSIVLVEAHNSKVYSRYKKGKPSEWEIVSCLPDTDLLDNALSTKRLGFELPDYTVQYSDGMLRPANLCEKLRPSIEIISLKLESPLSEEQIKVLDSQAATCTNWNKEDGYYTYRFPKTVSVDVNATIDIYTDVQINLAKGTIIIITGNSYESKTDEIFRFYENERCKYSKDSARLTMNQLLGRPERDADEFGSMSLCCIPCKVDTTIQTPEESEGPHCPAHLFGAFD